MQSIKRHLAAATALALALAALAGSALAAPPSAPPGNSGSAPGQQAAPQGQPAEPPGQATAPGQAKKAEKAPAATPSGGQPSAPGQVKKGSPSTKSNPTTSSRFSNPQGKPKKNVPAVAESAPDSSVVKGGPGKSGTHKVAICHKGHVIVVDAHAAKAHMSGNHGDTWAPATMKAGTKCGAAAPVSTTAAAALGALPGAAGGAPGAAGVAPGAAGAAQPTGGVAGAEATIGSSKGGAGGVAGAFATLGKVAGGTLPFTGFPLWAAVLIGVAALALGLALWRRGGTARDVV